MSSELLKSLRDEFPALKQKINGKDLVYLDSAAKVADLMLFGYYASFYYGACTYDSQGSGKRASDTGFFDSRDGKSGAVLCRES